jgi:hypothetical protein
MYATYEPSTTNARLSDVVFELDHSSNCHKSGAQKAAPFDVDGDMTSRN